MKYSIVVASARNEELNNCIKSIENLNFPKDNFEVVVLADKPWQPKKSNLKIKAISLPPKTHPSYKRNLGVTQSQGDILCFLDDDTEVEPEWLNKISKIIDKNPNIIISGPNRDKRKKFGYKIANAIQEIFFTEGLWSHSPLKENYLLANHHNIPLCHLIIPRKIYEKIGGFNEVADYFMDDVEFCYIASNLGYELRLYSDLAIQHNVRPLFFPYFKYKFKTRYKTGKNFLLFPECYLASKQIWLIGISYLILLTLPWLMDVNLFWKIAVMLLAIYLVLILFSVIKYINKPHEYTLIVLGIILVHGLSWLGFTIGFMQKVFELIFNYKKVKKILIHKNLRYKIFKNNISKKICTSL